MQIENVISHLKSTSPHLGLILGRQVNEEKDLQKLADYLYELGDSRSSEFTALLSDIQAKLLIYQEKRI